MRKFYTKFPGAKLTEPLWGAVAGVQEGQVLISRVSRHGHQASGIWVAFFPRCQRYRCGQARLMALGLHRPIMAGIDFVSRKGRGGKMEAFAVSSIIESGGYEDDEDDGDVIWCGPCPLCWSLPCCFC